jgi:hypothetical protein
VPGAIDFGLHWTGVVRSGQGAPMAFWIGAMAGFGQPYIASSGTITDLQWVTVLGLSRATEALDYSQLDRYPAGSAMVEVPLGFETGNGAINIRGLLEPILFVNKGVLAFLQASIDADVHVKGPFLIGLSLMGNVGLAGAPLDGAFEPYVGWDSRNRGSVFAHLGVLLGGYLTGYDPYQGATTATLVSQVGFKF